MGSIQTKEIPIRIIFVALLLLTSSCTATPNPAQKEVNTPRLDFLFRFFDYNEAAFAYKRHCLPTSEPINKKFQSTMDFVANELLREGERDNPNFKPEYVKNIIMERRNRLQYDLDTMSMKEGCASESAQTARAHYEEFSKYDLPEIRKFIDEQTTK